MAWNQGGAAAPKEKSGHAGRVTLPKRGGLMKGLVAGLVVVIGAVGVFVWLTSGGDATEVSSTMEKKPAKIADGKVVEQHLVSPEVRKVEEQKVEKPKPLGPQKIGEVRNGYVLLPSGRLHKRQGVTTNNTAAISRPAYAIFKDESDNELAAYLTIRPGDPLLGTRNYKGNFKEAFLKSLNTPIEITPEDTPEQAALKQQVIDARNELKAAYDRGEDVEQIMADTRQELQDMMHYKMELQMQFNDLRHKEDITDQDVEDMLTACNSMLEQKGISPITFGPIMRLKMKRLNKED